MEHSEKVETFAGAFVAAQQKIEGAVKDKTNPHFKSSYADLSSVMDACKNALNAEGIAILQTPAPSDPGTLAIDTVLLHKSGEWMSGRTIMPLGKSDPQGYGSAMTYARRYSLAAMVGVCPEDDDAEGAMAARGQAPQRPQQRQAPQPPRTNTAKPSDAEAFEITVRELFEARDFAKDATDKAIRAAMHTKKVNHIGELSAVDRKAFLGAAAEGKFDKFKNGALAGAGK